MPGQQPEPVGHAVGHGPVHLAPGQLGRGADGLAHALLPRAAVPGAQAELQQQLEVVVTRFEHPVVEGLPVVRVGAGLQQQPGQGQRMRMRRLPVRAQLTLPEHPGQYGERFGQPPPQVTGVGVATRRQQQPGAGQRGLQADVRVVPGVGQVVQRLGPVRAVLPPGRVRVGGQDGPQSRPVRRRRGRVHVARGQFRVRRQQRPGPAPPLGLVILVPEASQPQKLITQRPTRLTRLSSPTGLGGRDAGVALEGLDVPLEPGPAAEPVPAAHHQPGRVQRKLGRRGGLGRAARVVLGHLSQRRRRPGPHGVLQVSGLLAQLREVRPGGQRDGRHPSSFRLPGVRVARPKGGGEPASQVALRWTLPCPRTGGSLRTCPHPISMKTPRSR